MPAYWKRSKIRVTVALGVNGGLEVRQLVGILITLRNLTRANEPMNLFVDILTNNERVAQLEIDIKEANTQSIRESKKKDSLKFYSHQS